MPKTQEMFCHNMTFKWSIENFVKEEKTEDGTSFSGELYYLTSEGWEHVLTFSNSATFKNRFTYSVAEGSGSLFSLLEEKFSSENFCVETGITHLAQIHSEVLQLEKLCQDGKKLVVKLANSKEKEYSVYKITANWDEALILEKIRETQEIEYVANDIVRSYFY